MPGGLHEVTTNVVFRFQSTLRRASSKISIYERFCAEKLAFYIGERIVLQLLLGNELSNARNIDVLLTSSGTCSPSFA